MGRLHTHTPQEGDWPRPAPFLEWISPQPPQETSTFEGLPTLLSPPSPQADVKHRRTQSFPPDGDPTEGDPKRFRNGHIRHESEGFVNASPGSGNPDVFDSDLPYTRSPVATPGVNEADLGPTRLSTSPTVNSPYLHNAALLTSILTTFSLTPKHRKLSVAHVYRVMVRRTPSNQKRKVWLTTAVVPRQISMPLSQAVGLSSCSPGIYVPGPTSK